MLKCYYISQAVQPLMTQELPLPADTLAQGAGESIIPNIIFPWSSCQVHTESGDVLVSTMHFQ